MFCKICWCWFLLYITSLGCHSVPENISYNQMSWNGLSWKLTIVGKIHVNFFQGYLLKLFLPKNSVQHFKNTIKGYLEISPHLDNAHAQKWSLGPQRKRLGSAPLPPHPSHWHFRNCVCGLDPWGCPDHKCIVMCTYCLLHIAYCLCILKVTDHILFVLLYETHVNLPQDQRRVGWEARWEDRHKVQLFWRIK